jgi:hypothetical protein
MDWVERLDITVSKTAVTSDNTPDLADNDFKREHSL